MKVFNLQCTHQHGFEGWFGSDADYESQLARGLVACPLCADTQISRLPTAPRLNLARGRGGLQPHPAKPAGEQAASSSVSADGGSGSAPEAAVPSSAVALHSQWLQAVKHVMANTVDVGERFAEEARRIHYGEAKDRAIRGQASADETEALRDEGIDVFAMPVPESLKRPLQ